jgi:hypothetical protein
MDIGKMMVIMRRRRRSTTSIVRKRHMSQRLHLRWSPQSGVMMGIMKKRQMGIIYKLSCPKEKEEI